MGFFDELKQKAGNIKNVVIPTKPILSTIATAAMNNLKPKEKPMVFEVGQGLTPEQKIIADAKVRETGPEYKTNTEKVVDFGKDVLRAAPRAVATVGMSAGNLPTVLANNLIQKPLGKEEFPLPYSEPLDTTSTKASKFLFGERPVKTFGQAVPGAKETITNITGNKNIGTFGAAPIVVGGTLLDLTGFGGGARSAISKNLTEDIVEQLAKSASDDVAEQILKDNLKIPANEAKKLAPKMTAAQDAESVYKGLGLKPKNIPVTQTNETEIYNTLRENGISDEVAKTRATAIAKNTDPEVAKTLLQDTVAEQSQIVQKRATTRLAELEAKADNGILTHEELVERNYLKENINKPEELMGAYIDETPFRNPITKERKYVTSAKASDEIAQDVAQELNATYTPKSNNDLINNSVNRVAEDFEAAKRFARENSTDEAVATRVAVDKELSRLYKETTDQIEKDKLAKELAESIKSHARLATEEGRTVQANALLGKQTPEGMLRSTQKMIDKFNKTARTKVKDIGPEDVKYVQEQTVKIEKLPEGLAKEKAKNEMIDKLESLIPSSMWKKVINVWKAGLLTGVKTSGINVMSSFFNGAVENIKNIPATGIDLLSSAFTGKRTKALVNPLEYVKGQGTGVKKGWDYLRTGVSGEAGETALEFSRVHYDTKVGKALGAYAEGVYRVLGAEDMPFFYGALRRSLTEQALVSIKNKGIVFKTSSKLNDIETKNWVSNWIMNSGKSSLPSKEIVSKLSEFKPKSPITLYRGVKADSPESFRAGIQAWTKDKSVAETFAQGLKMKGSKPGNVISKTFNPDEILTDISKIPDEYVDEIVPKDFRTEGEVLVKNSDFKEVDNAFQTKEEYIRNFVNNPPEEALRLADMDAKIATFKNDTALGKAANAIRNSNPLAEIILPFAKTPSAVATAMLNYTPVGAMNTLYKNFIKGPFNQKDFAEGLGRAFTGSGALWLGSELWKKGKISLEYPQNEKERAQWEATGKTPNSILIDGKWVPLTTFGPAGAVLGIGGYVSKGKEETGSWSGGAISGLTGGTKSLTEQTFLTGVKSLIDAINEPEKKGQAFVGRTVGSIIPTMMSDFTQAFDDYQRKSNEKILDPLKARTPGLRTTLPKKLDVWGQPLERNRSTVATAISPIRLSNTIQGPLNTEVERLGNLGEDIKPTKVDPKISNVNLSPEEYYKYQRLYGNLLTRSLDTLIKNEDYQSRDPEEQAKLWKDTVSEVRKTTSELILPELIKRRYELDETADIKSITQLTNELYKKSPDFAKASPEKQKKVILKLMDAIENK